MCWTLYRIIPFIDSCIHSLLRFSHDRNTNYCTYSDQRVLAVTRTVHSESTNLHGPLSRIADSQWIGELVLGAGQLQDDELLSCSRIYSETEPSTLLKQRIHEDAHQGNLLVSVVFTLLCLLGFVTTRANARENGRTSQEEMDKGRP